MHNNKYIRKFQYNLPHKSTRYVDKILQTCYYLYMDYERIENQQEDDLPSEYEDNEESLRESYQEFLKRQGYLTETKTEEERFEKLKKDAISLYETALTDNSIPFGQRRQVADKVLEITGVIKPKNDGGGNTFVFSDSFGEKFLNIAEKMQNRLSDIDIEKENEDENEIRDTRDVTPT